MCLSKYHLCGYAVIIFWVVIQAIIFPQRLFIALRIHMCSLIKEHHLIIPNNSILFLRDTQDHVTKNMNRGANMYSASINNTCLSK